MKKNYSITLSAFILASILIDELTSTEQSALGNYFMLVGQTLCTNGSFDFNNDWKSSDTTDMLKKTKDIFNKYI